METHQRCSGTLPFVGMRQLHTHTHNVTMAMTSETETTHTHNPQQLLAQLLPKLTSDPSGAIPDLQKLQPLLRSNTLYSSNETLEDVSTGTLPLLAVDFHLAMVLIKCPIDNKNVRSPSRRRKEVLERAHFMLHEFLRRMEVLGLFERIHEVPGCYEHLDSETVMKTYRYLLEIDNSAMDDQECEEVLSSRASAQHTMTAGNMRNMKIQNFRLKRNAEDAVENLSKLICMSEEEQNLDVEELQRKISLYLLVRYVIEAMDQLVAGQKEFEMLAMAVMFEKQREDVERNRGNSLVNHNDTEIHEYKETTNNWNGRSAKQNKPMGVTRVTQDPLTGNLLFKREELQSKVFQPSWNQPSMTLAELGEKERNDALRREQRQKEAEAQAKFKPRRYEHLVKDGMEDDLKLVDASAKADRDWDDFKDANPRGSGNKMADRGDRNF